METFVILIFKKGKTEDPNITLNTLLHSFELY